MKLVSPNLYKSLLRLIGQKEEKVARELSDFLNDRTPTKRQRITKVAEVRAVLAELDKAVADEAPRIVEMAYNQTRRAVAREPKVDLFQEDSHFSTVHRDAINLLGDNLKNTLGEATTTLGRRTEDAFRRHGVRQAAVNLARESPIAAQEFERKLRADGATAFIDKRGRRWKLSTYCEMALKTTISEAQAQATINSMLSRGLDLVDIEHTGNHEDIADICDEFEGGTFSLTGATPGYPKLRLIPPFHPRCDHFMKPSPKGLAAALEARDKAAA